MPPQARRCWKLLRRNLALSRSLLGFVDPFKEKEAQRRERERARMRASEREKERETERDREKYGERGVSTPLNRKEGWGSTDPVSSEMEIDFCIYGSEDKIHCNPYIKYTGLRVRG